MSQLNFWNQLPREAGQWIQQNSVVRSYKKGSIVYSSGDQPTGIYFVRSGLVGLVTITNKGSEHLLRLFAENHFFGHRALFANEAYYGNTLCLENSEIGFVPRQAVEEVLKNFPQASRLLIETLARELGLAEMQRLKIADQEVLKRLSSALIYLKEIHPEHKWTRNEIAHFCASTGPTVIRGLAELEGLGLITQKGRTIEIIDRAKLIGLASE